MNRPGREDVAAAAMHRDRGRYYNDATAEGLVQRISAEIDRVVADRLEQRSQDAPGQLARPSRTLLSLGLGSMAIGVAGAAVVLSVGSKLGHGSQLALIAIMWGIIGIVNLTYAWRR